MDSHADSMDLSNVTIDLDDYMAKSRFPIVYVTISVIAIACNITILVVLFKNRELANKFSFIVGLALGDLLYSFAVLAVGCHRLGLDQLEFSQMVPASLCMTLYPLYYLLGNHIQSLNILLINVDRFLAIACAVFYFKHKSNKMAWTAELSVYAFSLISVGMSLLSYKNGTQVRSFCFTADLFHPSYIQYHFGLNATIGVLSTAFAVLIIVFYVKRRKKMFPSSDNIEDQATNSTQAAANSPAYSTIQMRKQINLAITVICIAVIDFLLVVVPKFLLFYIAFYTDSLRDNFNYYAGVAACLRCCCSLPIYVRINREFRQKLKELGCNRHPSF